MMNKTKTTNILNLPITAWKIRRFTKEKKEIAQSGALIHRKPVA